MSRRSGTTKESYRVPVDWSRKARRELAYEPDVSPRHGAATCIRMVPSRRLV
jgi:hypothetical protein